MAPPSQMILLIAILFISGIQGQISISIRDLIGCQDCILTPIIGGGSFSSNDLFSLWILSYGLLQPTVQISYQSGTDTAITNLLTKCKTSYAYDYAIESYHPDVEHVPAYNDLLTIPFWVQAVVLTYNLPGLNTSNLPLNLSRSVISQIYNRDITYWNHSAIYELNPDPTARAALKGNITLILRTDDTGITRTLFQALQRIDPNTWSTDDVALSVPERFNRSDGTLVWAEDQFAATSNNLHVKGSIGYNPTDKANEAALAYASIINRNGNLTTADADSLKAAVSVLDFSDPNSTRDPADASGENSYPLTAMTYGIFHKTTKHCDVFTAMLKFWHWCLTDPYAEALVTALEGVTTLPNNQLEYAVNVLESLECNGDLVLEAQYQDAHLSVTKQTMICLSGICMMFTLSILFTLGYKRKSRVTKAAGLAFAICFLFGCLLNYLGIFFWAIAPVQDVICRGRYGFVVMGYSLILGAMFSKSWELNKVFVAGEIGVINPMKEVKWWHFCRVFFSIAIVQGILLLIWFTVDSPRSASIMLDTINFTASHECHVKYPRAWVAVELVYFGLLLVWGAYLAYETRDVWLKYNYPNESRSILLSIYNLAFCGAILVPLMTTLEVSAETLFFLVSIAILWPTSFSLFSVYMPKLAQFLSSTYRHSGNSEKENEKNTRSGSLVSNKSGDHLSEHTHGVAEEKKLLTDSEKKEGRFARDDQLRPDTPGRSRTPLSNFTLPDPQTPEMAPRYFRGVEPPSPEMSLRHYQRHGIERTEEDGPMSISEMLASPSKENGQRESPHGD